MSIDRFTFKERMLAYRGKDNLLPNLISLIWIGDNFPNDKEHPYLENVFKHKRLFPHKTVQVFVNKKLLEQNGNWDRLARECTANNIVLRDIETTCCGYLNYDIILKLMQDKTNYVWASDLLRLALMFHEGGEYFDTDITPPPEIKESKGIDVRKLRFGFNLYFPNGFHESADFSYLSAIPNHFFYFYSAIISRYYYECVQEEIRQNKNIMPTWLESKYASVRQSVICKLSGHSTTSLIRHSSLKNLLSYDAGHEMDSNYQWRFDVHQQYDIKHDHIWLEGLQAECKTAAEEQEAKKQLAEFEKFYERIEKEIDENFLISKGKEYYLRNAFSHYTTYNWRPTKIISGVTTGGIGGFFLASANYTSITAATSTTILGISGVSVGLLVGICGAFIGACLMLLLAWKINRCCTGLPGFFPSGLSIKKSENANFYDVVSNDNISRKSSLCDMPSSCQRLKTP